MGKNVAAWETTVETTIYLAPEAGIDIKISDDFSLLLGGRFMIVGWTNETQEGLKWKWDDKDIGGNFVELYGGLSFTL